MMRPLVAFAFTLALFVSALAQAQELLVWQATPRSPKIVLPMLRGETPRRAVEAYYEAMRANSEMRKAYEGSWTVDFSKSTFTKLETRGSKARAIIQANTANDIDPSGFRMGELLGVVRQQQGDAYVLPAAAALRLNARAQYDFQDAVYDAFDVRVNIGGDDVHPKLYGQDITHARTDELNMTRDRLELALIRHWAMRNAQAAADGIDEKPEFGICRGHQLMAISTREEQVPGSLRTRPAEGHTMYQDNVRDGVSKDGTHLDRLGDPSLRSVQHWHHVYVTESVFARLIGKVGKVFVNDWHHESVKYNPKARTRVVAMAPDGVIEALEGTNGVTMSTQFHGEFTESQSGNREFTIMGHRLIAGILRLSVIQRVKRECSSVFRAAR